MNLRRILVLLMAVSLAPLVYADTHAAASASYADVAAAIALASDGDLVTIPAGSATWASTLAYSTGIHLQGNGIGSTIITHAVRAIEVTGVEGVQWQISGIEFISTGLNYSILSAGNCHNFRITACEFNNTSLTDAQDFIIIGSNNDTDSQYGVIDNCAFDNGKVLTIEGQGDKSWKEATGLGTDSAVYVEDCTFSGTNGRASNAIDANQGGRYVFRYNTIKDLYIQAHSLQNGDASSFARATRKWEIYENTWISDAAGFAHADAIGPEGGTGVVFNNSVTDVGSPADPWNRVTTMDNVRTEYDRGDELHKADGSNIIDGNTAVATGTGAHSGANNASVLTCAGKTWTTSAYVGNWVYNLTDGSKGAITANTGTTVTATLAGGTDNDWDTGDTFKITNGYPALDQIGRGIDYSLTPRTLPLYDSTYQPQALEPAYFWGNTLNTVRDAAVVSAGSQVHIQPNRDYYDQGASFDGTSGVGVGLLAARPATCTTGVGYWATDTEILYRAVAANTWEAFYTPYTYPHPLRGEGVAPDVMTVTSPNGGESWAGNSVHNITWTNTGDTVYANVKIEYSADSGLTWTTISASTPNDGSYAWTVPNTPAATYMIKVTAVV